MLIQGAVAKQQLVNIAASNVVTHRRGRRIAIVVIKIVTKRFTSQLVLHKSSLHKGCLKPAKQV